jgi:hypothetical protein
VTPRPAPVLHAAEDWQRFWQDAGRDGCTALLPPAVAAGIARGWQTLLAGALSSQRLLDVACGRGAILAQARARGFGDVCGVDLVTIADADPAIIGGIDAAQLPFADASFDIVASQFGIEYAGLMAAGAEAARVARQQLWLLLHAAEGPIAAQGREQLAQLAWLRDEAGAFALLSHHAETPATAIHALRAQVVARAETAENVTLLEGLWHALGQPLNGADAARLVDELEAYATRLTTMTVAAPTAEETRQLADSLSAQGWRVTLRDEGPEPVARWLIATRV